MNASRALRSAFFAAVILFSGFSTFALDYRIDVKEAISWETYELTVSTVFDLASAGLKLPTGRSQAEVFADMEFPRLARPTLYKIPVDSSTTVESMVEAGTLTPSDVGAVAAAAKRSAAVLSSDLRSLTTTYRIGMRELAASLIKHRNAAQAPKTLEPRPTRAYTGILIYASEELPLHGTHAVAFATPCFFPKIWDSEMNLIYSLNMTDPETAKAKGIVHYGSKLEEDSYTERVGKNPLRILAHGLFGILPTDPIIDHDDAMKI
ncbi:MAG: polymerase, partial [Treponemataceae bacterium]